METVSNNIEKVLNQTQKIQGSLAYQYNEPFMHSEEVQVIFKHLLEYDGKQVGNA